jgi:methyl-accepting chemotaxis protein
MRESGSTINAHSDERLQAWRGRIEDGLAVLRRLAGSTEHEFLSIGTRLQEIHQQATELSSTAQELVESASGSRLHQLIERLREMLFEMEGFLDRAGTQSEGSGDGLDMVAAQLREVAAPLHGVKRMSKHLYMLEVSIKIESAYLGDMGSEFLNLAMDIKKLSQQIKEKVNAIDDLRTVLTTTITCNVGRVEEARKTQDQQAATSRGKTAASLAQLEEANQRFSVLGTEIASVSRENSDSLSTIVQSMQFHDIYRQQVEHVVEALETLLSAFPPGSARQFVEAERLELIGRIGDVCELQQAQLQFASAELYQAVVAIIDNLRLIAAKQAEMADGISHRSGSLDTSGTSFISEVAGQMSSLAKLLGQCAENNSAVASIMKEVIGTVGKITGFVVDIESIGKDIIQIALNARIKASSAGEQGASMSVLAEEIGQMSSEAVGRTDLIGKTLAEIDSATARLAEATTGGEQELAQGLATIKEELAAIIATLDEMGDEILANLARVKQQVTGLREGIERLTRSITIHERTKGPADQVLAGLAAIFGEARAIAPASEAFKEDLRLMAQRYTMESERRIHESIAGRHGVVIVGAEAAASGGDSEFGDNVDLF